jgi:polar amino acid transport system substrate-binding protein
MSCFRSARAFFAASWNASREALRKTENAGTRGRRKSTTEIIAASDEAALRSTTGNSQAWAVGDGPTERSIMGIYKRFVLAASAAGLALSLGAAHAEEKTIRFGTEGAYPPFNNVNADGKLVGFEVDLVNALCDEMKAKCEFVIQDFDGLIPALQAKKFDAIIDGLSITEERKTKVDFTDKYSQPIPVVVVKKDSDIKGVTKEDLKGKTIGVQTSTTHAAYADATYTDTTVKAYPTPQEYELDMANGRLDAVLEDIIPIQQWLDTADGACCKVLGKVVPDKKYYGDGAGIAVRKGEDDLREKLNAAIKAVLADGTYKKINDKYFTFDAYGG